MKRGQVRRDAGLEHRLAGDPVAGRVRVEEVDAAEAVHLEVDEAGRGDALAVGGREADASDLAVDDLDVPGHELAPDESRFDAEPHEPSAARIRPSAASSRERAVSASTSASSDTIATFASPSAASSAASTSSGDAPVASSTMRRTRARSLSFVARTSTMRFPKVLPGPHHRHRRDRVEDELLGGARLQARRAGEELGADDDDDLVIDELGERRVGRRHDGARERAGGGSRLDRSDDERRAPARADAQHGVGCGHGCVGDRQRTRLGVVLGCVALGGGLQPLAGDDRSHPAGRKRERRLALGRIERRDRARGAGADVEQPAAAFEALDDGVDRAGDLVGRRAHGRRHRLVLVVHQLDELV